MITSGQEKYLATMPNGKIVRVKPFDPLARETGFALVAEVKKVLPNATIYYIGSTILGISGENDIDINVVSTDSFNNDLFVLENLYDKPTNYNPEKQRAEWQFEKNHFLVELYLNGELTLLLEEHIKTHEIIMHSSVLVKEYEKIKLAADGLDWKEYMRRKFEFFNKISETNN